MKKLTIAALLLVVLCLGAVPSNHTFAQSPTPLPPCTPTYCPPCQPAGIMVCPTIVLTQADNGKTFMVTYGEKIIVELPFKPGSSLLYNKTILGVYPIPGPAPIGVQVWGLQAIGIGTTAVIRIPYNDFNVTIRVFPIV